MIDMVAFGVDIYESNQLQYSNYISGIQLEWIPN